MTLISWNIICFKSIILNLTSPCRLCELRIHISFQHTCIWSPRHIHKHIRLYFAHAKCVSVVYHMVCTHLTMLLCSACAKPPYRRFASAWPTFSQNPCTAIGCRGVVFAIINISSLGLESSARKNISYIIKLTTLSTRFIIDYLTKLPFRVFDYYHYCYLLFNWFTFMCFVHRIRTNTSNTFHPARFLLCILLSVIVVHR